jgi:hypothetical protein
MAKYLMAGALGVAALLLVGLTAHGAPAAQPVVPKQALPPTAPLTSVDWSNFTYISSCFSDHPVRYVTHNGLAQNGGIHFQVYTPLFGDLTGDGRQEAFVTYSCTGADFGGVHLFVHTGTAGRPRLLADVPSPGAPSTGNLASVHTITLPVLTALLRQRILQVNGVGYSATATHTCPDLDIALRYQMSGDHLVPAGSTVKHVAHCLSL